MTPGIKPLVAGNWKMNGLRESLDQVRDIADGAGASAFEAIDMLLCPPTTLLYVATAIAEDSPLFVGAQDCHWQEAGAHTGDVSAEMIEDCQGTHVIVGHSERRADHGEDDETVSRKAEAAWRAGLCAVICIGETEAARKSGNTLPVIGEQLAGSVPDGATAENTIIAYEPVWAIGTGVTPTVADVAEAHAFIRDCLLERLGEEARHMRLLYGGSVKPGNAAELMAIQNVDGALVGGASLKATDFLAICAAYNSL
ncbi:triose-phosphate isomerase [Pararhizobium haloflavum]|uniref:triose-phosphate isomerase n=1 Tax=Pararhizobium haloflavum TaxID=2037914 RepID=UPI000C19ECF7|nr:triose-phosphate isomerase [Pararhizobium haloflavum]